MTFKVTLLGTFLTFFVTAVSNAEICQSPDAVLRDQGFKCASIEMLITTTAKYDQQRFHFDGEDGSKITIICGRNILFQPEMSAEIDRPNENWTTEANMKVESVDSCISEVQLVARGTLKLSQPSPIKDTFNKIEIVISNIEPKK